MTAAQVGVTSSKLCQNADHTRSENQYQIVSTHTVNVKKMKMIWASGNFFFPLPLTTGPCHVVPELEFAPLVFGFFVPGSLGGNWQRCSCHSNNAAILN